jgi:hypothetical protein
VPGDLGLIIRPPGDRRPRRLDDGFVCCGDAHDLAEAEGHDREIVPPQPERGQPDEDADEGRREPARKEGPEEENVPLREHRP